MNKQFIAVDCDGVLLDWSSSFFEFMESVYGMKPDPKYLGSWCLAKAYGITPEEAKEYIRIHNISARIGSLCSLPHSISTIKDLYYGHGYRFVVITALGNDTFAEQARIQNLRSLFSQVFSEIHIIGLGESKEEILTELHEKYNFVGWVEDNVTNANVGHKLGIPSYLMRAYHNLDENEENTENLIKVESWKEIANHLLNK